MTRLFRVCVTGPESTGKTTLAEQLARFVGTEWVPEASRIYAERVARDLSEADVEPIAHEHIARANAAAERVAARKGPTLVLDTDLLSTVVYAQHYYGFDSPWLDGEERARRADLYLLCDVDVPWVPDGIRDRPAHRDAMFAMFRDAVAERRVQFVVLRGDWDARWKAARTAVQRAAR